MTRYFTNRTDSWVIAINGNIVTGETYAAKETIKKQLGGRWDAERKVWIINPAKLEAAIKSAMGLYDASEEQIASLKANSKPTTNYRSGYKAGTYIAADGVRVCSKCHTVCYGDCTAN
jgi:hypothetical protein